MLSIPSGTGRAEAVGTGTSPTIAEPTAAQNGDVLFAVAFADASSPLTRPVGWTGLYAGMSPSTIFVWDVSWIRRGENAPSLVWTITGSVYREVYIVCLKRNNSAGPIIVDSQGSAAAPGSGALHTSLDPPATRAVAPSSLALAFGIWWTGSSSGWTPSTGYTAQTANAAGDDGFLQSKSLVVAGVEDPAAIAGGASTNTNDFWDGATVTFTDVPQVTPSYTSSPPVITKRVAPQQLLGDD